MHRARRGLSPLLLSSHAIPFREREREREREKRRKEPNEDIVEKLYIQTTRENNNNNTEKSIR